MRCFIFFSMDATKESNNFGRLINHSSNGNVIPRIQKIQGTPFIVFFASRDINAKEEILYDYNDNRPHVKKSLSWLSQKGIKV